MNTQALTSSDTASPGALDIKLDDNIIAKVEPKNLKDFLHFIAANKGRRLPCGDEASFSQFDKGDDFNQFSKDGF